MKYAIVNSGIVTNMARAASAIESNWFEAPAGCSVGWLHDGINFSAPTDPRMAMTAPELSKHLRDGLQGKQGSVREQEFDIGNGLTSTFDEIGRIREMMKTTGGQKFNLANGNITLTAANRTALKVAVQARAIAIEDRAHDIIELVKAATGKAAKIAVFDAEINTGWPV